jgi:uncharacterized protein YfbU (UPF0304 family)
MFGEQIRLFNDVEEIILDEPEESSYEEVEDQTLLDVIRMFQDLKKEISELNKKIDTLSSSTGVSLNLNPQYAALKREYLHVDDFVYSSVDKAREAIRPFCARTGATMALVHFIGDEQYVLSGKRNRKA